MHNNILQIICKNLQVQSFAVEKKPEWSRLHVSRPFRPRTSKLISDESNGQRWRQRWRTSVDLGSANFFLNCARWQDWTSLGTSRKYDYVDLARHTTGFNLCRVEWTNFDAIQTGHGKRVDLMYTREPLSTPKCDCGHANQTIFHMVNDCPIRKYDGDWNGFTDATAKTT